jgi:hypothetical protein
MTTSHERLNDERHDFWAALAIAAPDMRIEASPGWEKEVPLSASPILKFKISLSQDKTSVYLFSRSDPGEQWIKANIEDLAAGLRTSIGDATGEASQGRWFRKDNKKACVTVRRQWPEAIRWIRAQHATFARTVAQIGTTS